MVTVPGPLMSVDTVMVKAPGVVPAFGVANACPSGPVVTVVVLEEPKLAVAPPTVEMVNLTTTPATGPKSSVTVAVTPGEYVAPISASRTPGETDRVAPANRNGCTTVC